MAREATVMTEHDELRGRVIPVLQKVQYVSLGGDLTPLVDAIVDAMQPDLDAAYERGVADGKASMSLDARLKVITPKNSAMEVTIGYIGMLRQTWYVSIPLEGNSHSPGERIATCAPTCDSALDMAIAQALEAKGATNES